MGVTIANFNAGNLDLDRMYTDKDTDRLLYKSKYPPPPPQVLKGIAPDSKLDVKI